MKFKGLCFFGLSLFFLFLLVTPSHSQYVPHYVLDGYGGVHAGGGAGSISPATFYFGWDIARALQYVPVAVSSSTYGHGTLVLDGYGGVHRGGKATSVSISPITPYFGWDIARDLVFRVIPPRAAYSSYSVGTTSVTSLSYVSMRSVSIYCPDDGYVFVTGSSSMGNNDTDGFVRARVAIGMDSLTALDDIEAEVGLKKWVTGDLNQWKLVARTQMKFVTAGHHTFYWMARKQYSGDLGTILYFDPTISVIYVDMSNVGYSALPDSSAPGPEDVGTGSNIN